MVPRGVETKQFSSFDRAGGNGDFSRCLTASTAPCVIADHNGPGEVESIWFTRDGGDVRATGNITVTLDGVQVLHAPLQDVVDGTMGAPFVYPLVANADESSGGVTITVPMPFRQSMRISTDVDPIYYHVTYRTFADAGGVATFDPGDKAQDVVDLLKAAGTRDPKPAGPRASTAAKAFSLAPGAQVTLADRSGQGSVNAVDLGLPQLAVALGRSVNDDGRAFGADGSDSYVAAIDPANTGVRLTRRLDPTIGNQRAKVLVDGADAGEWAPLPVTPGRWVDEYVDIPAALTAGRSSITVQDVFVSSDLDFNVFSYWADSTVAGTTRRTDTIDVGPSHLDNEAAHHYAIVKPTRQGERTSAYPPSAADQAAASVSDRILAGARLRITADGQQTVDAPVGEFFGSGLGGYRVASLMSAVDPATHSLRSWWPMPYRDHVSVALYNGSDQTITGATAAVSTARSTSAARGLGPAGDLGYFRATSHSAATTPGADYPFLDTAGAASSSASPTR